MKVHYLLFTVVLSGCSSVWVPAVQDGVYTRQEAETICSAEAWKALPIKNELATETTWEKAPPICESGDNKKSAKGKSEKCTVDPYAWQLSGAKTRSYVVDVNEGSRNNYYILCMYQKGWKEVNVFLWEK